jgi:hypothetical protein
MGKGCGFSSMHESKRFTKTVRTAKGAIEKAGLTGDVVPEPLSKDGRIIAGDAPRPSRLQKHKDII